jgi:uncharacterized membrane protein YkvA (DUF1232 family)
VTNQVENLIPDPIPVLGCLDDPILIPREVALAECREKTRRPSP